MTETTIKNAIKRKLEGEDWILWFVHKKASRIRGRMIFLNCDIFTIFDVIAIRKNKIKLIQFTSKSNITARIEKIEKYYKENDLSYPCEVWGYIGNNKWDIRKLYD